MQPIHHDSDLQTAGFVLPKFIARRAEGLFVDLAKLASCEDFESFAEQVFASKHYFSELSYERFNELLYDYTPEKIASEIKSHKARGKAPLVHFATAIVEFPQERFGLYKSPKIEDGTAEYLFEPLRIERVIDEPLYDEDEDGVTRVVGVEKRTVIERTRFSFDEFVAAMWVKGVRYGIDSGSLREIIATGEIGSHIIARPSEALFGTDAGIEEVSDALYRDDAPKTLANGKVDLKQFTNRFPQIKKGSRLLMKTPRVLGTPGRNVDGTAIEPPMPEDFDLETLSGAGTRIEYAKDGDYIVSTIDGFLSIDSETNQIAVNEKIVNRSGVSVRTTGNISITAPEFEEHGEIQEKRVVEGRTITCFADVFGSVISLGGVIHLKQNLIGGSAINHDGDIIIDELVSRAVLQAKQGTITLTRVENTLIVGKNIKIESAVNCDILGDTVTIEQAAGCVIAGRRVSIGDAAPRKDQETVISIPIPDLSSFDQVQGELTQKLEQTEPLLSKKKAEIDVIAQKREVANYRTLAARIEKKEITLTADQKANWQKLVAAVAPAMKMLVKLSGELKALQAERDRLKEEMERISSAKEQASSGISCHIESMHGETLVRTMKIKPDDEPLFDMTPQALRAALRDPRLHGECLNPGHPSSFSWKYRD